MHIKNVSDFRKAYRSGPYAWPGGYPVYFITADGEALSFKAAKEQRREILEAIATRATSSGWCVCAADINYEDGSLFCAHTNERIPSAYAEDLDPREG